MVLVLRGELRLTAGKAAAQAAHAAVDLAIRCRDSDPAQWDRWRAQGARKIVLRAETLGEMLSLERAARARHLPTLWIEDAGLTEVPPGTRTCLGIGPGPDPLVDEVTGSLDLY
ncbi:MAG: aminoacyl-tRNA hydrolase [Thermoplasmata archaeon]